MSENNRQHPFMGHTITMEPLAHHSHPLSLNGPLVHVKAIIKKVIPDALHYGAKHMHFVIHQVRVLDIRGADPDFVASEIFCAVRYGDKLGLAKKIEGLEAGQEIELKGEYIDINHAYPTPDNPNDPVLHFTHHPIGFIYYQGVKYK